VNSIDVAKLKERACSTIDHHAGELEEISRYLYDHPEVAYEERLAVRRLTDYLEAKGFIVEREIAGLETAFRATARSEKPGPVIAFLSEYDALPDIGHGCGHNLIASSGLGAALGLRAALPELGGTVVVIGTPAEEFKDQMEGKVKLLQAGEFAGVDACMMMHPGKNSASYNSSLAFVAVDVVFHGQTAHAAGDPWNGRNALDGVIMLFVELNALRQHVRPDVRIHGIITDGGRVPNIIPERAAATFMIRAPRRAQVDELQKRFEACARGAALATNTEVEIAVIGAAADVRPYPTLQALSRANFEALRLPFDPPFESGGSTDFGDVSYVCPSESFHMALGVDGLISHSRGLAEATITKSGIESMINGAKVLAMNGIDILSNPDILERARAEAPDAS
jgi:amidohydrolase